MSAAMATPPHGDGGLGPLSAVRKRVQAVIEGSGRTPFPLTAAVLGGLSRVYGWAAGRRAERYGRCRVGAKSLPCRVISVGNLTVGGTGKTPMARYLAATLQNSGYRVAIVSRGYRGRMERHGAVISDGRQVLLGPLAAGDEPYMLAVSLPGVPVIVGRDRYRAGMIAVERFDTQVVILDDGFQHLGLRRDLNIVLLDEARPLGNGRLLPRGPLREPVAGLQRADAIVLTRSGVPGAAEELVLGGVTLRRPVFRCALECRGAWVEDDGRALSDPHAPRLSGCAALMLDGRRVLVFSGIADNGAFRRSVAQAGAVVADAVAFDDHHRYRDGDCRRIALLAEACGAQALVTTFKDFVKIAGRRRWPLPLAVLDVGISFGPAAARFEGFLRRSLEAVSAGS